MADQLDLFKGQEERDKGMQRAADNADRTHLNWQEQALQFLLKYPGRSFMTEEIRAWAYEQGLPKPPHDRAWGAVVATAKKLGLIHHIGYQSVKNPQAHATPASLWAKI